MRKHALKLTSLIAMALAMAFVGPQRAAADDDDPPTRVARLSQAEGSVSFEPAGTEDWVAAVVNRPLTTGDKLWADQNSRAELHLGSASIRLGANTGFSFLNLDDRTTQLQLTEGTLRIRIRRLSRDEIFEVDTPNLAFNASRPGIYRINVNQAGDTTVVVVRDGEGEVTGGGQSYIVRSDETGIFTGTDQLNADIEGVGDEDDLERWSSQRDRREDHSASRQYVSDEAIGYEDLDDYGGWRSTPEYGTIWFPRTTVVGWAPYRYGHWAYIVPWGYTWVDDEPWGFAPFHYGRWVTVGGSWGWVPCRPGAVGVAYVRPVYAPALVAWVGGPHVAIGVAVGGGSAVGWFPLGPREVYVPSYRASRGYVNNVNVTNTTVNTTVVNNYYNTVVVNKTNVNNVTYVNQRVPGAVTATSTQVMTTSQPVARNVVRVDERQIRNAQVTARTPAVAPERQAFAGGGRPTQARPPERIATRAVVAKTAPPPPPAPVDRQQALIRQNGGQPPAISQSRRAEPQQQARPVQVRMAPPARQVTTPQRDAGNRPAPPQNVNRPVQQPSNVQQNNAQQNNRPANEGRPSNSQQPNNAQPNRPSDRPNNTQQPNNAQPNRPVDRPNNERTDRPPSARPANPNDRPNTPPPNAQPNRPAVNDRSNTPPPNAQPNRPPSNERPANERNDRPPSARPAPPSAGQQEQQRATPPRQQPQERPQQEQRPPQAERQQPAPRQQPQERPQQEQRPPQVDRQQAPPPRQQPQERPQQQQERPQQQQQRPPQPERQPPPPRQQPQPQPQQQQRPPQAERQQPPQRQQQERPRQQEKPKEKDRDKDKPPKG